jgi:hypothetical protein
MVHMPQEREAKVQTLQQAVEQGSYHVPAEELAAKMLQDALQELLPELPGPALRCRTMHATLGQ